MLAGLGSPCAFGTFKPCAGKIVLLDDGHIKSEQRLARWQGKPSLNTDAKRGRGRGTRHRSPASVLFHDQRGRARAVLAAASFGRRLLLQGSLRLAVGFALGGGRGPATAGVELVHLLIGGGNSSTTIFKRGHGQDYKGVKRFQTSTFFTLTPYVYLVCTVRGYTPWQIGGVCNLGRRRLFAL